MENKIGVVAKGVDSVKYLRRLNMVFSMYFLAYSKSANYVVISTTTNTGFIADLGNKFRYPEKDIASLFQGIEYSRDIPLWMPSIDTIMSYREIR